MNTPKTTHEDAPIVIDPEDLDELPVAPPMRIKRPNGGSVDMDRAIRDNYEREGWWE